MSKTFSLRRHEVVELCPSVAEFRDRWPALFDILQINEEFRRITTLHLEPTFMKVLDFYAPKLITIFSCKGAALGQLLKKKMGAIHQALHQNIDETRDVVLRCLVNYLGEKEEDLIQEYNCDNEDFQQSLLQHILKIAVCKRDAHEDFRIILEGVQVIGWLGNSG
ncbi:hypothetical protein QQF64_009587 [Cirrhinus molitorella]|uniref:Uncharacterized protein n=1 Tax=Cirrhinus molitorella TaxID=172907 RepID=A0ABR3M1L1_9TELE